MTFPMYIAGLIGIVTIGAGIVPLYINAPQEVVHIDIKRPNTLLKIAGVVLIVGGTLNLIGNVYFGVKHWQENRAETAHQTDAPPHQDP